LDPVLLYLHSAHLHEMHAMKSNALRPRVRRIPFNYLLARGLRHFVCNYARSTPWNRQYWKFCRKN
jgi:hypothetical protein